jgi:hypothetical protein
MHACSTRARGMTKGPEVVTSTTLSSDRPSMALRATASASVGASATVPAAGVGRETSDDALAIDVLDTL